MQQCFSISFVTLGCAKNEVDTDKMQARLLAAGFSLVDDAREADIVIVNTCAFLTSAVDESLETIFDLVNQEFPGSENRKILVAGCMPARYGKDLEAELTEVSGFVSAADEEHIVEFVEAALGCDTSALPKSLEATGARIRHQAGPFAYVKISDGCDRFCSYCMIPHIRGRYHSYSLDRIEHEVRELVLNGVREIVLIGQDTGIWGRDFIIEDNTAHLVSHLAQTFPDTWFRLLYLQPAGITDELLDTINSHGNICSYLDMPLQHCNEQVLKRMNRSGSAKEFLELLEHIRSRVPGIVTRTTFMAGFPGETEEQFEELLEFADEAAFDYAVVFPYSTEEGSAAATFDDQVDEDLRLERAQMLLDACENIGTKRTARHIGASYDVIVEGYESTDVGIEALCRTQGQAPEVDGQVHVPIPSQSALPCGTIAQVSITGSFYYELEGALVHS